jgi:hypothetical protein
VTPNRDNTVRVRLDLSAWRANLKLSHMSLVMITLISGYSKTICQYRYN